MFTSVVATRPRLARAAGLVGLGLAAGLLLSASLPPIGWWPLGPVGVAVLAWALGWCGGWRARVVLSGMCGIGLYGVGLWWVTEFHALGWVVIVFMEAAIFAASVSVAAGGRRALLPAVAVPAALVVAEAFRGRWPFGGLPLAGLDLGQVGGPLLPAARLGGHLLLVGVVGLAGAGLAHVVRRRWAGGCACLGVVVAVALAGAVVPRGTDRGPLGVAAVQGGGARGLRAVDTDPADVLAAHLDASQAVPAAAPTARPQIAGGREPVALVVWPEDVVDVRGPLAGSDEDRAVADVARRLGMTVVAGVVEDVRGGLRFHNAAVVWAPDGSVVDRYEKVHRVPFGEYIPFRSFFEHLADLSAIPRDAIAGHGSGVVTTPAGKAAVAISFEVFFADRARSGVAAGGRVLLVPTNAASYTTSQVPAQELAAARVRAVETGRWVVQAAPTGYSGIVDERGHVRAHSRLGAREVLSAVVRVRDGRTLATRVGDAPIALAAVALLVLARAPFRKEPDRTLAAGNS